MWSSFCRGFWKTGRHRLAIDSFLGAYLGIRIGFESEECVSILLESRSLPLSRFQRCSVACGGAVHSSKMIRPHSMELPPHESEAPTVTLHRHRSCRGSFPHHAGDCLHREPSENHAGEFSYCRAGRQTGVRGGSAGPMLPEAARARTGAFR